MNVSVCGGNDHGRGPLYYARYHRIAGCIERRRTHAGVLVAPLAVPVLSVKMVRFSWLGRKRDLEVDILHKYDPSHVQQLKGLRQIPDATDGDHETLYDSGFINEDDAALNETPELTLAWKESLNKSHRPVITTSRLVKQSLREDDHDLAYNACFWGAHKWKRCFHVV